MKAVLSLLLTIGIVGTITAQSNTRKQTTCLISDIPILIESDPIIYAFDRKGNFEMGAGRIRVMNIGREQPFEFDHLLQMRKPLSVDQKKHIVPSIQIDTNKLTLAEKWETSDKYILIDTVLSANQKLTLKWQNLDNQTIQTITFRCTVITPEIIGTKTSNYYDSLDQPHKARQIKKSKILPDGYKSINGNKIEIDAGKQLDLKIKPYSLLTDSSILYRLTNNKESISSTWMLTGHLLTLPNLIAGEKYRLELKYQGQNKISAYKVIITPYWHQKVWIRLSGLLILIVITVKMTRWYFKRRIRRINEQRQRLEEQLTTIQSQLNPHFIFNALSSIEGLVTSGQNKLANEYLNTFSSIMRDTLKNSDKLLISLKEEVGLLEKYMSIEQLRFGFECSFKIDEQIIPEEVQVPPMLVQPLVENAVKHGAATMGSNGDIRIQIYKLGADMLISVMNNRSTKKSTTKTAGGYGWSYTKERLKHFTKLNSDNPIEFSFLEKDTTVEVSLLFKNWFS